MKKQLLLTTVLLGCASVASAATSITLYGRMDVGYESKEVDGDGIAFGKALTQESNSAAGNSRYGIRGEEDLGNGYAATFQLEGRFEADTGEKSKNRTFFDRESTVGIKTPVGHIRLGRSYASLEQAVGFIDIGRRYSSISAYDWVKSAKSRYSNGLFYNHKFSGLSVGAVVTTKGGYNDGLKTVSGVDNVAFSDESSANSNIAYGAFAKYKSADFEVGVGYQDDGVEKANSIRRQWAVGASYTFAPVTVGLSYSQGQDNVTTQKGKIKNIGGYISGKLSPSNTLMAFYRQANWKVTPAGGAVSTKDDHTRYGLGFVHSLSKRTSVYADVAQNQKKDINGVKSDKYVGWDIAVRHNF